MRIFNKKKKYNENIDEYNFKITEVEMSIEKNWFLQKKCKRYGRIACIKMAIKV